jgi:hypothetical protein
MEMSLEKMAIKFSNKKMATKLVLWHYSILNSRKKRSIDAAEREREK